MIKPCENCGTDFTVISGTREHFCSRACWLIDRRKPKKRCPICEQMYSGEGLTCSKACGSERMRRNNPKRKTECERCKGPMPRSGKATRRFCSRDCALRSHNERGGTALPDGTVSDGGNGYRVIKIDGAWIAEHRHVVGTLLGRELESHERVHHKNGNRSDNRPENLELWKVTKKDPAGVRAADYHCAGCRCGEVG